MVWLYLRNDVVKGFSRNEISNSIENLQNKWQQEEVDAGKRAAATTSARSINVTPAALDNITEVSLRESLCYFSQCSLNFDFVYISFYIYINYNLFIVCKYL